MNTILFINKTLGAPLLCTHIFFLFSHVLIAYSTSKESDNDTQNDSTTDPEKA